MRLLRTRLAAVPFLYNFEEKSRWTIQFEVGIVAAAFAIASFFYGSLVSQKIEDLKGESLQCTLLKFY